jgi:dolichol-phosphate mannosyltransferase
MSQARYDISVVIPTYNEQENIALIIRAVAGVFQANAISGEIVIADDNSPDGTAQAAEALKAEFPHIQVLVRTRDKGLSYAILDGFKVANSDVMLVMDADLSHPVDMIPKLLAPIQAGKADLVFGSRYMAGGGFHEWPWRRKLYSRGASLLARLVTRISDPMSGLFALHRRVIDGVTFNPRGFKIGLEILAKGNYGTVAEVPYFFRDRQYGTSKLDSSVMRDYLTHLALILFAKNSIFREFVKFSTVGLIGMVINMAIMWVLVEHLPFSTLFGAWAAQHSVYIASTIAFCVAVSSNFVLNRVWTFRRQKDKAPVATSFRAFILVSLGGLLINYYLLHMLHYRHHMWYMLAQAISICVASLWNFLGSKLWAFKAR